MKKISILGHGDIGKAIEKFYPDPTVKDLTQDADISGTDILHICIPYTDNFVKNVKKEIDIASPNLTIIHSTVAPETTEKFGENVVHSPVRGRHPNLHKCIKTYLKLIGAEKKEAGYKAQQHFYDLGINSAVFTPAKTTEVAKLLSTAYQASTIAFHGEAQKICDKYDVDFTKAMTWPNETYNDANRKLNNDNRIRPTFFPPPNDEIGGHCLIPNAKILNEELDSEILDLILKYA